MSDPYPSNLECWNNSQFSWDQPIQNFQSNWSHLDLTPSSSECNNFEGTQTLLEEMSEAANKTLASCSRLYEEICGNNQHTFEPCAHMDFEQSMSHLSQSNSEPLDSISNQTQEENNFNQVNQILMPQDSIPQFDKFYESVPPSIHLSQFEEFEYENHEEKEVEVIPKSFEVMCDDEIRTFKVTNNDEYGNLDFEDRERRFEEEFRLIEEETENMHEDEIFDETFCDDIINPFVDKCILHESDNNQCFDIFDNCDCIYLDKLFEENFEIHTINFLENDDMNGDNACINENILLNEIICEDNLNIFCDKKSVEEQEFTLEHVEKIVRTPFERKSLDLSIFKFDEQLDDNLFDDNVNVEIFGEIIEEKNLCFDQEIEVVWEKLFEDENDKFWKKRENRRRRLRRVKTKLERGLAKMTKRLSSTKSSLKRTHWNDGDRARGFRPREIKVDSDFVNM